MATMGVRAARALSPLLISGGRGRPSERGGEGSRRRRLRKLERKLLYIFAYWDSKEKLEKLRRSWRSQKKLFSVKSASINLDRPSRDRTAV
jgi:hypothetical protein